MNLALELRKLFQHLLFRWRHRVSGPKPLSVDWEILPFQFGVDWYVKTIPKQTLGASRPPVRIPNQDPQRELFGLDAVHSTDLVRDHQSEPRV